jgi:tetratricopeptide (TPR) repeat protein
MPAARAFVAADGTDDDPGHAAAYAALTTAERAALHDQRADELEAIGEESLRLGAIPYHRTRGSDPLGAGVEALLWAQERCRYLGFYHAAAEFARQGLLLVDPRLHPENWWNFTKVAMVALAAGGRAEEAAVLQDEARRLSQDPVIHMKLAYETAMVHTRHLPDPLRDHKKARAWANQAIAFASLLEDPKERAFYSVFNRNGLALIETREGNIDEALSLLNHGMERLDRELGLGEKTWHRLGLLYNRAQVNTMSGRHEAALADYAKVIELDDAHADHYFNRGNILRKLGRPQEAIGDYTRALELEPPFPEAYYNRGDALLDLGEPDSARADFERAIVLDPEHVDAHVNLAGILADLGDTDGAAATVDAGLALAPDHALLLCLRGRLFAETGAVEAAREVLEAALRSDSQLAEAWAVLGEVDYTGGDLDAALTDFDRAMEFGGSESVRFNRAVVYEAAGRFAEAAADFDAVLAATGDADAQARRDACRLAAGRTDG